MRLLLIIFVFFVYDLLDFAFEFFDSVIPIDFRDFDVDFVVIIIVVTRILYLCGRIVVIDCRRTYSVLRCFGLHMHMFVYVFVFVLVLLINY